MLTPSISGALSDVRLPVTCPTSGDLVIEVWNVVAGVPGSSLLTSQTVPQASLPPFPGAPSFRTLVLVNPVNVTSGTSVAIVL